MADTRSTFVYLGYMQQRRRCARIVTFRVGSELNELIAVAARSASKSKSEFIRESVVEFIKFLEDNIGVEVSFQKYLSDSKEKNKKGVNDFVVLV